MNVRGVCLVVLLLVFANCIAVTTARDPDIDATPEALITEKGFPVETHNVPTPDGYLLQVQRIPSTPGAPVVYLQHGLLDSSCTWISNSVDQSLGFILSRAGYDVWLGNQRGNRFSSRMADGGDYNWAFTMDEMARFDDEALLTYITNATSKPRISWVGHSRGTQQMFYGLSRYPHHANYLNLFVALAPVAWIGHARVPLIKDIAAFDSHDLLDKIGLKDFLPYVVGGSVACEVCPECCGDSIAAIMGAGTGNATRFNQSRWDVYVSHFPAGTSSREMAHYAQLVVTNTISMYNFGSAAANQAAYGSTTPPLYDLTQIPSSATLPIALFTGGDDDLADPADVQRLVQTMGASRFTFIHNEPDWNHADFVLGITAKDVVYPLVVDLLKKYNP
eukprot:gnl/Spiro4/29562_TR14483_c0_g1_i1.p1 gnl/Spiro4/29562_TR14483_c0_g1~~gnl/Spiro4/29562_TR14483_c0_g1_i1.p1  ORF type:complete len:391 (+),score=95.53 gnl/Spiro4/29562_TR14483_c0_g1_i1:66-1238(+)